MNRRGPLAALLAAVSDHTLRVVGVVMILLSAGVTATTLATEHGIGGAEAGPSAAATATTDVTVPMLIEFATAHPAYPVALLVGLVLVVSGEDAPLLGR